MSEAVLSICKIDKGDGKCNIDTIVDTGTHIVKYDLKQADIQTDGCDNHQEEMLSCDSDVSICKIQEEQDGSISSVDKEKCGNDKVSENDDSEKKCPKNKKKKTSSQSKPAPKSGLKSPMIPLATAAAATARPQTVSLDLNQLTSLVWYVQ